MKAMGISLNLGILLLAGALAAGEKTATRVKLIDFERPQDITAIKIAGGGDAGAKVRSETSEKLVIEGKKSLYVFLPTVHNNGPRWPHFIIMKPALHETDWRIFHRLVFNIHVLKADNDTLHVKFLGKGTTYNGEYFKLKTGENKEISCSIAEWRGREKTVNSLLLCGCDLKTDNQYILDNFQLELDYKLLAEDIRKFQGEIQNCADDSIRRDAQRLQGKDQLKLAKKLLALKDRYAAWQQEQTEKKTNALRRAFAAKNHRKDWGYGSATPLTHVFRDLPFAGAIGEPLKIALAKNETEGIQLILHAFKPVKNVEVSVSPLTAPGGVKLNQVKCYLVGHVKTAPPSYRTRVVSQWRPDPLLDFQKRFDLDANVFQALWIDVRTASGQPAGIYRGTILVRGDGVKPLNVPLEVKVWNFALPSVMTFDTFFNYFCNYIHLFYEKDEKARKEFGKYRDGEMTYQQMSPKGKRLADLDFQSRDLLLDHHITPDRMYHSPNTPWKISELKDIFARNGKGFNAFYVSHVPGAKEGDPYPAWRKKWYLDFLKKAAPEYKKAGIWPEVRVYCFDEVGKASFAMAREMLKALKQECPDLPLITTGKDPSFGKISGLRDVVDIWVPNTPDYEKFRKEVDEIRKEGKKVWYYTADYPFYPYANLNLEDPASGSRLLVGFMARQQESDGFLYWQTTAWKNGVMITHGPLTEHDGASDVQGCNGSGILIYPTPHGPIPSIRLKHLRDGLEDYEYTALLRKVKPAKLSQKQRAQLEKLLPVPANVCTSVKSYDMDGNHLLEYRQEIGEFLSALGESE